MNFNDSSPRPPFALVENTFGVLATNSGPALRSVKRSVRQPDIKSSRF